MLKLALCVPLLWADPEGPLAAFPTVSPAALAAAGLPGDSGALAAYVRERLPAPRDAERLTELVRQLGDRSFSTRQRASRELAGAGPKALPFLREASTSGDAEVRRRALTALTALANHTAALQLAAQKLSYEKTGVEIPLLLGLASLGDERLTETALAALAVVTTARGVDPALLTALHSDNAPQRAAAAITLGRLGSRYRGEIAGLQKDVVPQVRLAAVLGLLAGGERSATIALAGLVNSNDFVVAHRAEEVLRALAGANGPLLRDNTPPALRHEAWDRWARRNAETAQLQYLDDWLPPVSLPQRLRTFVRRSFEAFQSGDAALLSPMIGPQLFVGMQVHARDEWLESRVKAANAPMQYFRGLKVVAADRYLPWARSPREVEFLQQWVPKQKERDRWTVFFSAEPGAWGAVFVSRQQGRLQFDGITIDRAGEPD